MAVWDLTIAVTDVHVGVADDSIVTISTTRHLPIEAGGRVLAFAHRICEREWRLWGQVFPVGKDGRLPNVFDAGKRHAREPVDPDWFPTIDRLRVELNSRAGMIGSNAFNLEGGVALVRLGARIGADAGQLAFECDSIRWELPTEAKVPRTVEFDPVLARSLSPIEGDSLLLPIARGSVEMNARLTYCPQAFVVRDGFAPGLGVPLGAISRAVNSVGTSRSIRRTLGPQN